MFSSSLHKATTSRLRSPVQPQHKLKLQCSLRPPSSQPSPALARHSRSAETHLLPPLLPCPHRWFSTAPVPDLGSKIWGAATAAPTPVYLTVTFQHLFEFPEQHECSQPRDPSCSRHSAQAGGPQGELGLTGPRHPRGAWRRARHGAAAAAPRRSAH